MMNILVKREVKYEIDHMAGPSNPPDDIDWYILKYVIVHSIFKFSWRTEYIISGSHSKRLLVEKIDQLLDDLGVDIAPPLPTTVSTTVYKKIISNTN